MKTGSAAFVTVVAFGALLMVTPVRAMPRPKGTPIVVEILTKHGPRKERKTPKKAERPRPPKRAARLKHAHP